MNEALQSGESEQLDALSDPGCGGCTNVLTAIADASSAGRRVREAVLQVDFAEAPAIVDGETIVDLRYARAGGELVDARGETVQRIAPEGPIDTQLRLRYAQDTWSVLGFRRVPS